MSKCQMCSTERLEDELRYFDINGCERAPQEKETANPDACAVILCADCLGLVESFNGCVEKRFNWFNLTMDQRKAIWPYVVATNDYGLWYEVFGRGSYTPMSDFSDWLKAVINNFYEWDLSLEPMNVKCVNARFIGGCVNQVD